MSSPSATALPAAAANHAARHHLLAGATGAIVTLAITLTLGVFAFAPLGTSAAEIGIAASFATAVVSATVMALRSHASLPIAGPSSATALIFAGLLADVIARPQADGDRFAPALLAMAAAVLLCGLLQFAMARGASAVSQSPGTLFGEMATLEERGRSADAIADVPSELLLLSTDALATLCGEQPEIGAALYRNMARYLAERLRVASIAWTSAAA